MSNRLIEHMGEHVGTREQRNELEENMTRIVKKGDLVTFASGEYSDYCVWGLVEAVEEFDLGEIRDEWYEIYTEIKPKRWGAGEEHILKAGGVEFLPYLVSKGLVVDRDYFEVHTGCYGECDISYGE